MPWPTAAGAVYILVTKRADASTLSVVNAVKAALPDMQAVLPPDIHVSYEFDQSPYVTRAIWGVVGEGALGAMLVGLMILLFLHDWRSTIVVLLNIPLALMAAVVALWLTGQTINVMTLGGLALAIGILVDEATVEIENIHTQMSHAPSIARAVRLGNAQTAVPRLLGDGLHPGRVHFLVLHAGRGRGRCSCPCRWRSGFSMVASYLLSSTFVPVLSVWLLRHVHLDDSHAASPLPAFNPPSVSALGWLRAFSFERFRQGYERLLARIVRFRWGLLTAYLVVCGAVIWGLGSRLGTEIFPTIDTGQLRLRIRAPDGTDIDRTEQIVLKALKIVQDAAGGDNVQTSLGYLGTIGSSYPVNAVYQWMRGPEDAVMLIALKKDSGIQIEQFKETLREDWPRQFPASSSPLNRPTLSTT